MDRSHTESTISENKMLSSIISHIVPASLFALGGYLLGSCEMPFGTYPLAIALCAAADKNAIFVFAGALLSAQATDGASAGVMLAGIYTALLLLRILVRLSIASPYSKKDGKKSLSELFGTFFDEPLGYRVCAAAITAFAISFINLLVGGFLYYDLFGLILNTALSSVATCVFYGFFAQRRESRAQKYLSSLGLIAILCASVYSAAPIKIYGVSLAVAGGMLAVLCVCQYRSALSGLLLSVAAGVAYSPTLSPIFIICAISYVIFSKISTTLVATAALIGSLSYAFYAKGIYALDGISGGIICACLLFSVIVKLGKRERHAEEQEVLAPCKVLDSSELDSVRLFDMNRRMSAMSEGFANLSDLFEQMKLKFPRTIELGSICRQAFESSCVGCSEYSKCRYNGALDKTASTLCKKLDERGALSIEDLEGEMMAKCGRLPDIIDEINYNFDARYGRRAGTHEGEIFAQDKNYGYKALSMLLGKSMERDSEEYLPDLEASAVLCEPLRELNVGIGGVIVYGSRQKRVYIRADDIKLLDSSREQICKIVRSKLYIELDGEGAILRRVGFGGEGSIELFEKVKYSLEYVTQSSAASDERFCGDSLALFENSEGRFFAALSDGMGSGRDAALMAELTTGFIKNMLASGAMSEEILAMLNSFLHNRCDSSASECSATLDLMELDEATGNATFFKCGAAPTYVYRSGALFKLRSRTMPLGILPDPDVRMLNFKLDEGDVVIMMSDGVSAGKEDCPYLFDLLKQNIDTAGSARTADLIMKYAKGNGSGDDITVAIMKVSRA